MNRSTFTPQQIDEARAMVRAYMAEPPPPGAAPALVGAAELLAKIAPEWVEWQMRGPALGRSPAETLDIGAQALGYLLATMVSPLAMPASATIVLAATLDTIGEAALGYLSTTPRHTLDGTGT